MNHIDKLLSAASFAAEKHRFQRRKGSDAEPYINHPLEVADLLAGVGRVSDPEILIAALLHDTIEDTETTREELVREFGEAVASLVCEVTDDKSLPKAERKQLQIEHAPTLTPGAKQIKLADKISNMIGITKSPPANWSHERKLEYVEWGRAVVAGLRGSNRFLEARFDEAAAAALESIENA